LIGSFALVGCEKEASSSSPSVVTVAQTESGKANEKRNRERVNVTRDKKPKCFVKKKEIAATEPINKYVVLIAVVETGELKVLHFNGTDIPAKNYREWKSIIANWDVYSNGTPLIGGGLSLIDGDGRKYLVDASDVELKSPLDIGTDPNSVVAFKLVPPAWVFDKDGFEISPASRRPDKRKAPFYLDDKYDHPNEKRTVFVRYDPHLKSPTGMAEGFKGCHYKYDLPVIFRSKSDPNGDYDFGTVVVIDPIINNDGGPGGN